MRYLRRIQSSPTGKVHYAEVAHKAKGVEFFNPLCNHRNWIGDYWGKKWTPMPDDTKITCKNCLSAAGELDIEIQLIMKSTGWASGLKRKFRNQAEVDAYIQGLKDATKWKHTSIEANGKII